jgi:diketogulonate reductase-like aldo/keto reductase
MELDIHGTKIPALGFGTAGLTGASAVDGVRDALEIGYRHIDTAQMYRNEAEVGKGIAASGVPRGEIFLVTKIVGPSLAGDQVGPATEQSLKALGVDAIDLLLIHGPSEDIPLEETLTAMAKQKAAGRVRHIGVSNFRVPLMEEAMGITEILANQVPYQPGRTQRGLCEKAKTTGFMLTAYSPLRGKSAGDPTMEAVAKAHGKTPQQVALRWLLQQPNVAPIPRSSSPQHRRSNFDVFDFELTDAEMSQIFALADATS